jgi:hypothetical protein
LARRPLLPDNGRPWPARRVHSRLTADDSRLTQDSSSIAGAIGLDWLQLKIDDPAALPAVAITAALGAWLGNRLLDSAVPHPRESS